MGQDDPAKITALLVELRQEHRDLDLAIDRLGNTPGTDEITLKRMKKRRLHLKDLIAQLESRLIPDLDA